MKKEKELIEVLRYYVDDVLNDSDNFCEERNMTREELGTSDDIINYILDSIESNLFQHLDCLEQNHEDYITHVKDLFALEFDNCPRIELTDKQKEFAKENNLRIRPSFSSDIHLVCLECGVDVFSLSEYLGELTSCPQF